jgi:hypothetical protein
MDRPPCHLPSRPAGRSGFVERKKTDSLGCASSPHPMAFARIVGLVPLVAVSQVRIAGHTSVWLPFLAKRGWRNIHDPDFNRTCRMQPSLYLQELQETYKFWINPRLQSPNSAQQSQHSSTTFSTSSVFNSSNGFLILICIPHHGPPLRARVSHKDRRPSCREGFNIICRWRIRAP